MNDAGSGGLISPPFDLEGYELPSGWRIGQIIRKKNGDTGGTFSVGYHCQHKDSSDGFLKAIDLYRAVSGVTGNVIQVLGNLLEEVRGEWALLEQCRPMDRIVTAKETGEINELHGQRLQIAIPYIVFECADSTARRQVHEESPPHSWCLRTLHQVAVGLSQMHGKMIAHQDVKLSNVLLFSDGEGAKLSDLGRSVQQGRSVPHDQFDWPGDLSYAPPEFAYGYVPAEFNVRRFSADLYLLGSCASVILSGAPMNAFLYDQLPKDFHPPWQGGSFTGTFAGVLPHLQDAFERSLERIRSEIPKDSSYADDLINMLRQWCNPDPGERGHPRTRAINAHGGNIYNLERYLSQLDLISRKAAYDEARTET